MWGGSEIWGGGLQNFSGPFPANNKNVFGAIRLIPVEWPPLLGDLTKGVKL